MQIRAGIERINESLIARELGENTQFDLRVVGNHQSSLFRMAHETATIFDCVGHLLDVGVRAREASGRRANLAKVGVQAASRRINELHHILAITGQRLLHCPVF